MNATQTLAGDIQLAGDLAGSNSATAPLLTNTAVTPGTYTFPTITVDAKGRLTAAASDPLNLSGDLTGLPGSNSLIATGVSAGTYALATITVDTKGRITAASSATLAGEVQGPAGANYLSNTGVIAGTYNFPTITVDSKGRITSASTGVVSLGGDLSGSASAATLINTAVTPGTYNFPTITVDSKGRITSAANGSITLAGDVTGAYGSNSLSTTGVSPGSYSFATITVNAQGRVTSASSGGSDATTTTKGVVQIGSGLTVSAGVVSTVSATNSIRGVVNSANTDNITITAGAINVGANIPKLNVTNTFTKSINSTLFGLTSGASIAVDASQSNVFALTLATNATLANPINLGAGRYTFIIKQDATGSRTLGYGTSYLFPNGADKTLSTAANSVNVLTCVSNGTSLYCSLAKNFV